MKTGLYVALTAVLVGALAFFGGVKYGQMRSGGAGGFQARFGGQGGFGGQAGAAGGQGGQNGVARFRGGFADGEVIAADAKSITVKAADGSTKTVYFDSTTRVVRSAEATLTDLSKGITVVVGGTPGDDGSITARSVQIVPKGSNLGMFGRGAGGGGQGRAFGQGQAAPQQQ